MTETEIYAYYKARHRCVQCHKQDAYTLNGRILCYECTQKAHSYCKKAWNSGGGERQNEKKREYHRKLREQHRCTYCGKELPQNHPYVRCDACRIRFRLYKRKQTEARTGYVTGEAKSRWQYGQCFKCGAPLKQGKNTDGEPYHVCEACYQSSIRALEKANETNRAKGNQEHIWTKENVIAFGATERSSLQGR